MASIKEVQPHDRGAEQALLGSMMLAQGADRGEIIANVAGAISAGDFYSDRHHAIFQAIVDLNDDSTPIDVVTVGDKLGERLEKYGGHAYLLELMQSAPHAANAEHYAGIVREHQLKRQTLAQADELKRLASNGQWDPELVRAAKDAIPDPVNGVSRQRLVRRAMADVASRPVWWLWPGRIPLGKLTLLAGDPGLGKSFLTIDIAARVSRGCPWPDDRESAPPKGDVILLSAEDDPADTIRPRLDEAGGDPSRVYVIDGIAASARRGERPRSFCIDTDIPALDEMLDSLPETRLIVIDPISAYGNGSTDTHKNADVRVQLAALERLAQDRNVAVLVVSHLNKSGGGKAVYRVTGSLAYTAAVRTAWLLAQDRDDESRRLFLQLKNNLAQDPGGLAFSITGAGRVVWEPDPVDFRADDLVATEPNQDRGNSALDEAEDFLRERLGKGAMLAKDLYDEFGNGLGGSRRTLERARKSVGIVAFRDEVPGPWFWRLPDTNSKTANSANGPPCQNLGGLGGLGENKGVLPDSEANTAKTANSGGLASLGDDDGQADSDDLLPEPF